MYSPYDQENNQITPPNSTDYYSPFRILASGTAIGAGSLAVGAVGVGVRGAYHAMYKNMESVRSSVDKMKASGFYKGTVNPLESVRYLFPKFGAEAHVGKLDKAFYGFLQGAGGGKIGFGKGSPGRFAFNQLAQKGASTTVGKSMIKMPVLAPLSALMTITGEFDANNHPSSLPMGIVREGGGILGGVVGQMAGVALGGLLGGAPGMMIGGLLGGAAGGMFGLSMPEIAGKMKSAGRAWTMPDVGGTFKDSQMAQTMRSRSLNAIRTSQFNVRSSLGSESQRLVLGI